MNISKSKTPIAILIAILWIACIVTGTTGHFVVGMCLGVVLMFLHMMLGVAKNGIVSKRFLIYPMLTWAFGCARTSGCRKRTGRTSAKKSAG